MEEVFPDVAPAFGMENCPVGGGQNGKDLADVERAAIAQALRDCGKPRREDKSHDEQDCAPKNGSY